MSELPLIWIGARATGLVAYVLLTLSMLAGLTLRAKPFSRLRPATVMSVHRTLATAGLAMVALHAGFLVADSSVEIRPVDLVVPGSAGYRPAWTAAGVLAAELMALLVVSFRLRKLTGPRIWRNIHRLAFLAFALTTVHGVAAGSDSHRLWVANLYVWAIAVIVGATVYRLLAAPRRPTTGGRPLPSAPPRAPGVTGR